MHARATMLVVCLSVFSVCLSVCKEARQRKVESMLERELETEKETESGSRMGLSVLIYYFQVHAHCEVIINLKQ